MKQGRANPRWHTKSAIPIIINTRTTPTEGINVLRWEFLHQSKPFQVNIWDFGGHEIYHTTHQFFLTQSSLYILVADDRKEDTDFYYWLDVIELLTDNSPVMILQNQKKGRVREIDESTLRGRYTNLREIIQTDLIRDTNFNQVYDLIQYYITRLDHVGDRLPATWVRVREQLENDARNYIYQHEFFEICHQNDITRRGDILQLSEYLRKIGAFLHFKEDDLLKNIVILNPEWGTDAVYKVLDNKTVIRNAGRFSRNDLSIIWHDEQYTGMYGELLQLMMKFQLCYEIPYKQGHYIAPQLLNKERPASATWDESNNLHLRFEYGLHAQRDAISSHRQPT